MNEEVMGLDSERLLELKFVRRVVHDEVKPLDDGDERNLCFLPSEGPALQSV